MTAPTAQTAPTAPLYAAFVNPARDMEDLDATARLIKAILSDHGHHVESCTLTGECTAQISTETLTLTLHRPTEARLECLLRTAREDAEAQDRAKSVLALLMRQAMTVLDPEDIAWMAPDASVPADTFRGIFLTEGPRRLGRAAAVPSKPPLFLRALPAKSRGRPHPFAPNKAQQSESRALYAQTAVDLREIFRNQPVETQSTPTAPAGVDTLRQSFGMLSLLTAISILPSKSFVADLIRGLPL